MTKRGERWRQEERKGENGGHKKDVKGRTGETDKKDVKGRTGETRKA
jgi:hypothetical protein